MVGLSHVLPSGGYGTGRTRIERCGRLDRGSGPQAAEKWLNGFVAALFTLVTDPRSHGLAHENDHFSCELRQLLYGRRRNYRALYTIRDDRSEVVILTIRHAAQDDVSEAEIDPL